MTKFTPWVSASCTSPRCRIQDKRLESVYSLAPFGVTTVADLATPKTLLGSLDRERLEAFAQCYEVDIDWLLTGKGTRYKASHSGWYVSEIARRLTRLWSTGELTRVRFVANRSQSDPFKGTRIIITLEKKHPAVDHCTLNESFPVVYWDQDQRWLIANLILFCKKLHEETRSSEIYPSGAIVTAEASDRVWRGQLHLAQALREDSFSVWETISEAEALPVSTRTHSDVHDWEFLATLVDNAVAGWRGRRELGGHSSF